MQNSLEKCVTKTRVNRRVAALWRIGAAGIAFALFHQQPARADEGGVSFWLPGQFGSLAASPLQPGWNFGNVYYHTSVKASGNVAASRQITINNFNQTVNVNLDATLRGDVDANFMALNYVFAQPLLGGQLQVGMVGGFGRPSTTLNGTLTASVGGLAITREGTLHESRVGVGDLYPLASLRWNQGVHNYMIYGMGDIPVGMYNSSSLANLGIGHGAADAGFGYTYLNPASGHEFSAVTGFTYNFENTHTNYQNGINWHLDWGASQFLSKQFLVGAVGYFYQQITPDKGQSPILGDFKSRVIGIGPQMGYLFPIGDMQGYLNFKGYYEFEAENRPRGVNTWITFAISPAAPSAAAAPPRIRK